MVSAAGTMPAGRYYKPLPLWFKTKTGAREYFAGCRSAVLVVAEFLDKAGGFGRLKTDLKLSNGTCSMIEIAEGIYVSEDDLVFKASRSGGPGGQNVNKLNTRAMLLFDVANCKGLGEHQKQKIFKALATRIDKNGVLRVVSQKSRSQAANRRAAVDRLRELLGGALMPRPVRKKTKVPQQAHQQRLRQKKRRSLLKQERAKKDWAEHLTG